VNEKQYKGDIVAGSLLVRESQILSRMMLDQISPEEWHQKLVIDNILQKRSPETAKRQARLIKGRLKLMKPDFWELIDKGKPETVIQALLAASIKHSRLLGDFMDKIVKSHWQVFKKHISVKDWQEYLDMCSQVDPNVTDWTDATRNKIKQVIFRILAEANYIDNTRSLELLPVSVVPEVKTYLINNSEDHILNCMEITP